MLGQPVQCGKHGKQASQCSPGHMWCLPTHGVQRDVQTHRHGCGASQDVEASRRGGTYETDTVVEVMSAPAVTVRARAHVGEAAGIMMAQQIHSIPVVDADGRLMGYVVQKQPCDCNKYTAVTRQCWISRYLPGQN